MLRTILSHVLLLLCLCHAWASPACRHTDVVRADNMRFQMDYYCSADDPYIDIRVSANHYTYHETYYYQQMQNDIPHLPPIDELYSVLHDAVHNKTGAGITFTYTATPMRLRYTLHNTCPYHGYQLGLNLFNLSRVPENASEENQVIASKEALVQDNLVNDTQDVYVCIPTNETQPFLCDVKMDCVYDYDYANTHKCIGILNTEDVIITYEEINTELQRTRVQLNDPDIFGDPLYAAKFRFEHSGNSGTDEEIGGYIFDHIVELDTISRILYNGTQYLLRLEAENKQLAQRLAHLEKHVMHSNSTQ